MEQEPLFVVLPYFNYCKFQRRRQLFLEFVERIRDTPNIRLIVSEVRHENDTFHLPKNIPGVYMHHRFVTKDRIWLKENLINLAIQRIPEDWKYLAWIDADITFLTADWVQKTMEALKSYDVVQMFDRCVNMGPRGEALKIDKGFAYMWHHGQYIRSYKYNGKMHPGFAWAMTSKGYQQMGGLIDWAILGSGDRHMALALIGDVEMSAPGNISRDYGRMLAEYQERCKGLRLGYAPIWIMHHWHGRFADRKYKERWSILTHEVYMPRLDIERNQEGILQLTKRGERLSQPITEYFEGRQEDST